MRAVLRTMARVFLALLLAGPLGRTRLRAEFLRGDVNLDGRVNITDAVADLAALFRGARPPCDDAADANDDGALSIDDPLAILGYLFVGGELPAPGTLAPGADPTCDTLDCAAKPSVTPAVVLSEIQYNPVANIQTNEYIELHNRSSAPVSLAGYRFTNGIQLVFPEDAEIPAEGFALVAKNPKSSRWTRLGVPLYGPYEGELADGGERITLEDGDCLVETVKYDDRAPWSVAADGSGRPLERVSYLVPADDPHAWRASEAGSGSPGEPNTVFEIPPRPTIADGIFEPAAPRSSDTVDVVLLLDGPRSDIERATLHWEAVGETVSPSSALELSASATAGGWTRLEGRIPPQPSQSIVRTRLELLLTGGRTLFLPHPVEPRSFLSYFVYDGEVPATLPILWLFPRRRSGLPGPVKNLSAAATLKPGAAVAQLFDGADVRSSRNGQKVKFLKGEEYDGDRTVNIAPEEGGGGTGLLAPQMEHMGFTTFHELGALAPWAEWHRVIDLGSASKRHTQRLVIEQINERFLEKNGLSSAGDLYKYVYQGLEKHTNPSTGTRSFLDLVARLNSTKPEIRRSTVVDELDGDNVCLYSVVGVLIANWDGFHNNVYVYNDLSPGGRWKVIPWDLDQVFEPSCATLPVTRPLTGEGCNSREPGVISRPYHLQPDLNTAYRARLLAEIREGGLFTLDLVNARIDATEARLLEDLDLLDAYLGAPRAARRAQIRSSYSTLRTYAQQRIAYLESVLAPP